VEVVEQVRQFVSHCWQEVTPEVVDKKCEEGHEV
jgi:hypothetical protein